MKHLHIYEIKRKCKFGIKGGYYGWCASCGTKMFVDELGSHECPSDKRRNANIRYSDMERFLRIGWSYGKIAKELHCSRSTIKQRDFEHNMGVVISGIQNRAKSLDL